MRKATVVLGMAIVALLGSPAFAQQISKAQLPRVSRTQAQPFRQLFNCDDSGAYCTDLATHRTYEGKYVGHDEPALAFYSNVPGSGNSMLVHLTLPTDPTTLPKQDGTGGTFNFQTQPVFWFGMAMCDTQSAPAPDFHIPCTPDSDANIFENTVFPSNDFVTLHPGTAEMELQFYAPGWLVSPDPTHWLAAVTIDSLNFSLASFTDNNADCLNKIGDEPVSFAFLTRNGRTQGPPDPLNQNDATFIPDPAKAFFMNPGDHLLISMHDSPDGFMVIVVDQTTKQLGWMRTSVANGFQQVVFQPDPDPAHPSVTCSEHPYAFHPMYSTSSERTRVVWAAHAFNTGFVSEIGHFEYCASVDVNGNCIAAGSNEPDGMLDADDMICGSTLPPGSTPFVPVAGCVDKDLDFDGVSYQTSTWPGSLNNPVTDHLLHGTPVQFSGPQFRGPNGPTDYDRVAFESNIPGSESLCNPFTGKGCVNPPPGAAFYPIFTTGTGSTGCVWQFGGAKIAGTTNTFGGNAATEFGPLTSTIFPAGAQAIPVFQIFRQVLNTNPCP